MTTGRRSRNSYAGAIALAFVLAVTIETTSAHRRDEYLQAARLSVDANRVRLELDLTPGIAIVDRILPEIDLSGDGVVSAAEAQTYAQRVLTGLSMDIDGQPLRLMRTSTQFPSVSAMRQGEGVISIGAVAALPELAVGDHRLHYRNVHRSDVSVYLANALMPATDRVTIAKQERDVEQRDLVITYALGPLGQPAAAGWVGLTLAGVLLVGLALVWKRSARR